MCGYQYNNMFVRLNKFSKILRLAQDVKNIELNRGLSSKLDQVKFKDVRVLGARKNILEVAFGEEKRLQYPTVWLRDNCQCSECYEPGSSGRIINLQTFRTDCQIRRIETVDEDIVLVWDDGHESKFQRKWLLERSFDPDDRNVRIQNRHPEKKPWSKETFVCKNFHYEDVMKQDSTLLEWLETLAEIGVAVIKNTPSNPEEVEKLAARIAFQRRTLYGTVFHVKNVTNAYNLAYRIGPLQFHSDIPHYIHIPGANLLHCLVQSSGGGENTFCDALTAISQLPVRARKILTETLVDWVDKGEHDNIPFHIVNRAPVICEDIHGKLERINWNQGIRDSYFNVNIEEAEEWYEAMNVFTKIIHDKNNMVMLKIKPGDILTFDNSRLVHGRLDYTDGERHVVGAYMDWDEMYSTLRVLRTKLKNIKM